MSDAPLDLFRRLTHGLYVVGVAHGRAKAPGVLGAIRAHLIDSLVCDETLARSLLTDARTAGPTGGN